MPGSWVVSWGVALQHSENDDDPDLSGATLRQSIRVTLGGEQARLTLSHEYGRGPLHVADLAVARPEDGRAGTAGIEPGSSVPVTFDGGVGVVVTPGRRVTSDAFPLPVAARENLTVTMRFAPGQRLDGLTGHPGSRTTSHVAPAGDPVDRPRLQAAVPTPHWYVLAALEVPGPAPVAVFLGDSLTDGRGSTTDGNDRWPDQLLDRLDLSGVGFVNQAAGGNRVLNDGLGPNALARLDRDVLAHSGVSWLIVFEGVNDIGMADATAAAQRAVGDELVAAYADIIDRAHGQGLRVYGATITPFGGHGYDDPAGLREQTRARVNAWIRDSFDAVLDFAAAVRDPGDARRVRAELHDGDGLHLNPAGYAALAATVPPELFRIGASGHRC